MRLSVSKRLQLVALAVVAACSILGLQHRAGIQRKVASLEDLEEPDTASAPEPPLTELAPGYMRAPYLQSLGTDSVIVAWVASAAGEPAVDYGTTLQYGQSALASSEGDRRGATLRHLSPGTHYFYRVRAGTRVLASGADYCFRTDGGPGDADFAFFSTGDVGKASGEQRATAQSILRANPRPAFGLVAGDLVLGRGHPGEYDSHLMRPWHELLAQIPVWPALGNHDWLTPPETHWCQEWYLPNNEHYYSFDYGSAHFIALDTWKGSLYRPAEQLRWLEDDLQAHANSDWLFVFFHYPGITCTYKTNNEFVVENLMPIFDRYHVDVVFNGHAHTYERLYPLLGGKPVDQDQDPDYVAPHGTLYIVSGCGGRVEHGAPTHRCGTTAFFKDETMLWTRTHVQGSKCTIESFASSTDQGVDVVTITKPMLAASGPSGAPTPAVPPQLTTPLPEPYATVSLDSARAIAVARIPGGRVDSEEIEREHGRLVYSFYIKQSGKAGVDEVNVDAVTGLVVTTQHEAMSDRERASRKSRSGRHR